jgi:hypothetical protein
MNNLKFLPIIGLLAACSACSMGNWSDPPRDESAHPQESSNSIDEEDGDDPGYLQLDQLPTRGELSCAGVEIDFLTDFEVYQTPDLSEPQPRTAFNDPIFGTCIIRVTDRVDDILNPNDPSYGMKNEYSRVQSFNADGSLLLVWTTESFWYVYDAVSLQPLGEVPVVVEPRWDARDPALLYYFDETRLVSYNLLSGTQMEIRDFATEFPKRDVAAVWTRYEGSPSFNSRWWGLLAQDADWEPFALLVYDLVEDRVITRELPAGYSIDNVTISPKGNYLLASFDEFCEYGQLGTVEKPCGLMVYDRDLTDGRGCLRIIGHYDTALDADDREVIVYQDIDNDIISMLDLESGVITPLLPIDFSYTGLGFHFSGRASLLPGWVAVSTYNGGHPTDYTWMDDVVFALELKAGGRVVRLAHTHSLVDEEMEHDYWAEPHVSVNQDFTRVLFTSNWGRTGTEEVDLYMVILPDDWVEMLP